MKCSSSGKRNVKVLLCPLQCLARLCCQHKKYYETCFDRHPVWVTTCHKGTFCTDNFFSYDPTIFPAVWKTAPVFFKHLACWSLKAGFTACNYESL